jgi:hypothetical protein
MALFESTLSTQSSKLGQNRTLAQLQPTATFVPHCRPLCAAQRMAGESPTYFYAVLLAELMGRISTTSDYIHFPRQKAA